MVVRKVVGIANLEYASLGIIRAVWLHRGWQAARRMAFSAEYLQILEPFRMLECLKQQKMYQTLTPLANGSVCSGRSSKYPNTMSGIQVHSFSFQSWGLTQTCPRWPSWAWPVYISLANKMNHFLVRFDMIFWYNFPPMNLRRNSEYSTNIHQIRMYSYSSIFMKWKWSRKSSCSSLAVKCSN